VPRGRGHGALRVIYHSEVTPWLRERFALLAGQGLTIDAVDAMDDGSFHAALPAAEVIWHALRPLGESDMTAGPNLRLIQKIGVGVNTINLEAARRHGIAVCNMPGSNAQATAEMTLLLMLACLRCLPLLDRATREGRGWRLGQDIRDAMGELSGRTVGLVGFGTIPRTLAPALTALGAELIYTATAPKSDAAAQFVSLDELLRRADILSLHVPQTAATIGMIGAAQLARMKRGAILINTARGGLVDELALIAALRSGRLAAAGLDVFTEEPVGTHNPLLQMDNVVVTPHLGWLSRDTLARSLEIAAENCRRLAAGEALLHRVV
jgi:phosphoglycerate dehydrogenase-like enzyme